MSDDTKLADVITLDGARNQPGQGVGAGVGAPPTPIGLTECEVIAVETVRISAADAIKELENAAKPGTSAVAVIQALAMATVLLSRAHDDSILLRAMINARHHL